MPAVFFRIAQHKNLIIETILSTPEKMLKEFWQVERLAENRLSQWCQLIATQAEDTIGYFTAYNLLHSIFNI